MATRWTGLPSLARNVSIILRHAHSPSLMLFTAVHPLVPPMYSVLGSITTRCITTATAARTKTKSNAKRPVAEKVAKKTTANTSAKTNARTKTTGRSNTKTRTNTKAKTTPKPKTKAKAKRPISEEQQLKEKAREMRKQALDAPTKPRTPSAFMMYVSNFRKGQSGFKSIGPEIGISWKSLPDSEKEKFKQAGLGIAAERKKEYIDWIDKHTPVEVEQANIARKWLKKHKCIPKAKTEIVVDHRAPERPKSAYLLFIMDRAAARGGGKASADITNMAKEWRLLPDPEKKKFSQMAAADLERYKSQRDVLYT